jgi:hypothetical protein
MPTRGAAAVALLAGAVLLAGCGSSGLRYKPEPPGVGAPVSADYTVLVDRVRVEIDTRGTRLEDVQILKPDGTEIRPETIEFPGFRTSGGLGVGIGMGGSTYRGGGVGVGTGVGFGTTFPVGDPVADGNTVAYFLLDQVGPAPWRLRAQLSGLGPVFFVIGGSAGAPK